MGRRLPTLSHLPCRAFNNTTTVIDHHLSNRVPPIDDGILVGRGIEE